MHYVSVFFYQLIFIKTYSTKKRIDKKDTYEKEDEDVYIVFYSIQNYLVA